MRIVSNPPRENWAKLLQRPVFDDTALRGTVSEVLQEVKRNGDAAIRRFTEQFDGVKLDEYTVSSEEIREGIALVPPELQQAIRQAAANIRLFHEQQVTNAAVIETMPGVQCWRKSIAIEKIGLYIPGGTAPLFSTILMLGIPASIAGCREVVLCSP
ncbi:MAG: histidinol dehydrogenase, partial [Sediminibacterium sp.]|nr:histidinol dehydrogenase [Sediminibacterium sp.]